MYIDIYVIYSNTSLFFLIHNTFQIVTISSRQYYRFFFGFKISSDQGMIEGMKFKGCYRWIGF